MFFKCSVCGEVVSCAKPDYKKFSNRGLICPRCFTVIYMGQYPKNIKGGVTLFSPFGEGLGDLIVSTNIKEKYLLDNPGEYVIFSESWEQFKAHLNNKRLVKIFVSSIPGQFRRISGPNVYRIVIQRESKNIKKFGMIYPQNIEKPCKPAYLLPDKYITVHLRNIDKVKSKNIKPRLIMPLLDYIADLGVKVVFVGNDKPLNCGENIYGLDLRGKLSLGQIGYVLENSLMFLGRDSGIAHIAGATGCPAVVWGYETSEWFADGPGLFTGILRKDSNFLNILENVKAMYTKI